MLIACFGDSLVYGFPFGGEYSWLKTVERETGHHLMNFGRCGETTVDIGQRLRFGPFPGAEAVLFFGGANDVLQLVPPKASCAELGRVLDFSARRGLPVCVVLPLLSGEESLNGRLQDLRDKFAGLCEGRAMVLDLLPAVGNTPAERAAAYLDGFHPKAAVYERMGRYAAPLIDKWCREMEK